ncbi:hypothetical protein B2G71_02910 [Novosphingobium sp. PC22D]|uniref:GIY-YIG nuclease family protein n=1 Tax=Novosphingobium sp. PC22D TaxID=1962403 RepID=UPI000BEFF696|nr:GIY-YIG nuclease family protein [Novosphingobium sp. PC22D]PEQ14543.1 hypothetical protein B2G71_02910 [Novosphingobium sp. PC22D]
MSAADRKAQIDAYKERKVEGGVYAVRCAPTGAVWVGRAPDIATIRNRVWFTLRQGSNTHRALQEAWNAHGPEAFAFEVLEVLDRAELALAFDRELKKRHAAWVDELGATSI